mmetsp:Transcript_28105/g.89845  ORF Transcript_28105/g.89845 Transcript_28105/m.89845 type:complete len:279 (+) Transcript_28105:1231-2067(+)
MWSMSAPTRLGACKSVKRFSTVAWPRMPIFSSCVSPCAMIFRSSDESNSGPVRSGNMKPSQPGCCSCSSEPPAGVMATGVPRSMASSVLRGNASWLDTLTCRFAMATYFRASLENGSRSTTSPISSSATLLSTASAYSFSPRPPWRLGLPRSCSRTRGYCLRTSYTASMSQSCLLRVQYVPLRVMTKSVASPIVSRRAICSPSWICPTSLVVSSCWRSLGFKTPERLTVSRSPTKHLKVSKFPRSNSDQRARTASATQMTPSTLLMSWALFSRERRTG